MLRAIFERKENNAVVTQLLDNHIQSFLAAAPKAGSSQFLSSILRGVKGAKVSKAKRAVREAFFKALNSGDVQIIDILLSVPRNIRPTFSDLRRSLAMYSPTADICDLIRAEKDLQDPKVVSPPSEGKLYIKTRVWNQSRIGNLPVLNRLLDAPNEIRPNIQELKNCQELAEVCGNNTITDKFNKELAAVKIQKVFRGFKTRRAIKAKKTQ